MRIIARKTLGDFWGKCGDSEQPLKAWFQEAKQAKWNNPNEIKAKYLSVSILKNGRVVFYIGGGKYRLVVRINYRHALVYIRYIGTYEEYDDMIAGKI